MSPPQSLQSVPAKQHPFASDLRPFPEGRNSIEYLADQDWTRCKHPTEAHLLECKGLCQQIQKYGNKAKLWTKCLPDKTWTWSIVKHACVIVVPRGDAGLELYDRGSIKKGMVTCIDDIPKNMWQIKW